MDSVYSGGLILKWLNHSGGEIVAQTPAQWFKPRAVISM